MLWNLAFWRRYWLRPAAVVAAPAATAAAIASFADLYIPEPAAVQPIVLIGAEESARLSAAFAGRLQFAVASLMVCLASLAGIAFALRSVARAVGVREAWILLGAMVLFGLGAMSMNVSFCEAYTHPLHAWTCSGDLAESEDELRAGEKLRYIAVEHVFADIGPPETLRSVQLLTAFTTLLGAGAVAVLTINFALLSMPLGAGGVEDFRARRREQQMTLILGALILTLSVNSTRGLYHWPLGMLGEASAETYSGLIAVATAYWGLFFTAILVAAAAPAMLALNRDIDGFAAGFELGGGEKSAWLERTGLAIAPRQAVIAAAAAAAPVLSSPALDLLSGLFG